jgi:hypothetical protein
VDTQVSKSPLGGCVWVTACTAQSRRQRCRRSSEVPRGFTAPMSRRAVAASEAGPGRVGSVDWRR